MSSAWNINSPLCTSPQEQIKVDIVLHLVWYWPHTLPPFDFISLISFSPHFFFPSVSLSATNTKNKGACIPPCPCCFTLENDPLPLQQDHSKQLFHSGMVIRHTHTCTHGNGSKWLHSQMRDHFCLFSRKRWLLTVFISKSRRSNDSEAALLF